MTRGRKLLTWVLLATAVAWAPAVLLLHGRREVAERLLYAFSVFLTLFLVGGGAWALLSFLDFLAELADWRTRRRVRRLRQGLCVQCGYDLRASANRCPECGTITPPGANAGSA